MSTPANAIECLPVPTLYQYPRALPGSSPLHHAVDSGAGDQRPIVPPLQNSPIRVWFRLLLRYGILNVFLPTGLGVRQARIRTSVPGSFYPPLNPVIWIVCVLTLSIEVVACLSALVLFGTL